MSETRQGVDVLAEAIEGELKRLQERIQVLEEKQGKWFK
jgi:hypothetical protein